METFDNTPNARSHSPVRRSAKANALSRWKRVWYQREYSQNGNDSHTAEAGEIAARVAAAKQNDRAWCISGIGNRISARDDHCWLWGRKQYTCFAARNSSSASARSRCPEYRSGHGQLRERRDDRGGRRPPGSWSRPVSHARCSPPGQREILAN